MKNNLKIWLLTPIKVPEIFLQTHDLRLSIKKTKKRLSNFKVSGIAVTNNEIKDTINIIGSSKNTGILLKGTTRKISQKGRLP